MLLTRTKQKKIIFFIFIFVIYFPLIGLFLDLDSTTSYRNKINFPEISTEVNIIKKFPGKLKYYLTKEYGFQDFLINSYSSISDNLFVTPSSRKVLKGKDNWLFLASEGVLDYTRNLYPFSDNELVNWGNLLQKNNQHATEHKAKYYFAVVPNKHTIYAEYLPEHFYSKYNQSRYEQLLNYMNDINQKNMMIDLRESLYEAKLDRRIYHTTDTHWNEAGAYTGYKKLLSTINQDLTIGLPLEVEFKAMETMGGDLARLLGLKEALSETVFKFYTQTPSKTRMSDGSKIELKTIDVKTNDRTITYNQDAILDKIVIFHDSMGLALIPYISEHCKQCIFVRSDNYDYDLIEQEKPDLVLHILVERRLGTIEL